LDACPFPPDKKPPEKDFLSRTHNLYDEVFGNWKIVVSILSAASLILAYSLLTVPPPVAPSVSVPDSWGRAFPEYEYAPREVFAWVPEYENQMVQQGDLLLEGEDVLLIENCTYVLNGQLLVKDNARLILRNAELFIQEKREWASGVNLIPAPVHMGFNNSAVFKAHNSSIIYPDSSASIGFLQNSEAVIDSSRLDSVNIYGDEESTICVSDSTIGTINVAGGANFELYNSEVSSISCYSIVDRMRWFRSESDWERCRVEVWNSTLDHLHLKAKNCDATILAPLKGFHRSWNSYEHVACERGIVLNVTFHNTEVTGDYWGLSAELGNLRVENSKDVEYISVRNGSLNASNSSIRFLTCDTNSAVCIENCNMDWLSFEGGVDADISGSKAELLILDDFEGSLQMDMFSAEEVSLYGQVEAYMEGSALFGEDATGEELYWDSGFIVRSFEVGTRGGDRVLPNVRLTLYDDDDNAVWSGQTDKNGEASFNITFCHWWPLYEQFKYVNDYEDTWRLEATDGEFTKNATVCLFNDTPIVFTFPSVHEPPFWRQRWLLSAVSISVITVVIAGVLARRR
jgi:hypothetical protein